MKVNHTKYFTPSHRLALRNSFFAFMLFGFLFSASAQVTVQFSNSTSSDAENSGGNVPGLLIEGLVTFFAQVTISDLQNGTATSGSDYFYSPSTQTVTIPVGFYPPGSVFALPGFSVTGDGILESDETINFQLISAVGEASLGPQTTTTYTILNDDSASVLINNGSSTEGTSQLYTVSLDNAVDAPFTVSVGFTNITATGGPAPLSPPSDYENTVVNLAFAGAAGESQQFNVATLDDNFVEGTETFTLSLSATNPLIDVSDTGQGTITDNDAAGVVVSPISGNTTEAGGTATFTVTLTAEPTGPVTIPLTSNTPTEGTVPADVTINPGQWNTGVPVTVTGVDDAIVDGDINYVIITGNVTSSDPAFNALNGGDVANVPVINEDNEVAGVLVSTISGNTTEAGGTASFLVTLTAPSTDPVTVDLSSSDPSEGSVVNSVTIPVAAWSTGVSVVVTGLDDDLDDGDIAYAIITGNVTSDNAGYNALTGAQVADVAVINEDDDTAGVIVSIISGNTNEGGGTATFTVTLTAQPIANVVVDLSSSDPGEGSVPATVSIPPAAWDSGVDVTVTGVDDPIVDGDILYTIITGNVTSGDPAFNALTDADVNDISVINEDDDTASLSITNESELENVAGGTMTFTVTLDNEIAGGTQVSFSFIDGTAVAGADYNGTAGTLVFVGTAGETATIPVSIIDESLIEIDETFTVQLGTPTNGVLLDAGGSGIGTILNDDVCGGGTEAPQLNTDIPTVFCDVITVSLNNYVLNSPPPGSDLIWSINPDPLETSGWLSDSQVNNPNAGTYFGFF